MGEFDTLVWLNYQGVDIKWLNGMLVMSKEGRKAEILIAGYQLGANEVFYDDRFVPEQYDSSEDMFRGVREFFRNV